MKKELKERKLENQKSVVKNQINNLFYQLTENEKNYICCGRIRMETEDKFEKLKERVEKNKIDWELVSLLIQATIVELNEQNNK